MGPKSRRNAPSKFANTQISRHLKHQPTKAASAVVMQSFPRAKTSIGFNRSVNRTNGFQIIATSGNSRAI